MESILIAWSGLVLPWASPGSELGALHSHGCPNQLPVSEKFRTIRSSSIFSVCWAWLSNSLVEVLVAFGIQLLMVGVRGFLIKPIDRKDLNDAIGVVTHDGVMLCGQAQSIIVNCLSSAGPSRKGTVHVHLAKLYKKMGVHSRREVLASFFDFSNDLSEATRTVWNVIRGKW